MNLVQKYVNKRIGLRLKEARLESKLTQQEIAAKMGYSSPATVSNHESGTKVPSMFDLARYASFYEKPVDYFLQDAQSTVSEKLNEEFDNPLSLSSTGKTVTAKNSVRATVLYTDTNNLGAIKHDRLELTLLMMSDDIYLNNRLISPEERGRLRLALEFAFPEISKMA